MQFLFYHKELCFFNPIEKQDLLVIILTHLRPASRAHARHKFINNVTCHSGLAGCMPITRIIAIMNYNILQS